MLTLAGNLVAVILQHSINAHTAKVFRSSYLVIFKDLFHIPCTILTICWYSNIQIGRLSFMSIVTYSIGSVYYVLVLGNRSFLNLLFHQILLFHVNLTEYVNYFVIYSQKSTFSKIKADFSCNLALNITIKPLLKLS